PCAGQIIAAVDGFADLVPPRTDPVNPAGNHVVVACGRVDVELAHLRQGSIVVRAGDMVGAGDALGRVGNSGNTTEPHLHVHAVDRQSGEGVEMTFKGRSPI